MNAVKSFDDALDDAVHAVLGRFGLRAADMIDTAEALNDRLAELMSSIVDSEDLFAGVPNSAPPADGATGLHDLDLAVSEAAGIVLAAFDLRPDLAPDTMDLTADAIRSILDDFLGSEPEDGVAL